MHRLLFGVAIVLLIIAVVVYFKSSWRHEIADEVRILAVLRLEPVDTTAPNALQDLYNKMLSAMQASVEGSGIDSKPILDDALQQIRIIPTIVAPTAGGLLNPTVKAADPLEAIKAFFGLCSYQALTPSQIIALAKYEATSYAGGSVYLVTGLSHNSPAATQYGRFLMGGHSLGNVWVLPHTVIS